MFTTQQPVFRRFWYATVAVDKLKDGPQAFTLLGQPVVLFLDARGEPAALEDRCCHRTAKLSKGWCKDGNIVCGYHGWEYDRDGKLVMVPQFPFEQPIPDARAKSFHARARYGYVWVALEEPLADIPEVAQDLDPTYRRIAQFDDAWNTAALRLMENSFDAAHIAFVHKDTFGDINQPKPEKFEIVELDDGFEAETVVTVRNPPNAARITGTDAPYTKRTVRSRWYLPFCRRSSFEYESGVHHVIFNCATPIADDRIQVIQILFRNDTEAQCSAQELIAWDAAIVAEDRDMLEATSCDAIVDMSRKIEMHMPSDRPGMIMRKRLLDLMRAHGEQEVTQRRKTA
jgi:phenylpropionate dioxygenase-like ring-hydroxylating dioxygenase large terminal subunit